MRSDRALLIVLLMVGGSVEVQAADAFRQLKGREITAKFKGQEFTDEVHFAEVFNPDGSLTAISMGVRKSGRWRVSGDELCRAHVEDKERCFDVWVSGRSVQLRQEGIEIFEEGIVQKPKQRQ